MGDTTYPVATYLAYVYWLLLWSPRTAGAQGQRGRGCGFQKSKDNNAVLEYTPDD